VPAGSLRKGENANDDQDCKDGCGKEAIHVQAAIGDRFVQQVADGRTKRPRQDKGSPKQRRSRDTGEEVEAGDHHEPGTEDERAAADLQLTATLPIGFAAPAGDQANVGFGNIELGAKYRFLHQNAFGLDVSIFPRSSSVSDNHVSILLPVWLQKDWEGSWSLFGGGGCVLSTFAAQDYCLAGAVVTHQFASNLQLGVELFHQTADANGTLPSTSVGLGATYDLNETYHLLGYVNRGVQNANQTDQFSFYFAVLFTF
jgi:hypothetical protein